MAAWAAVIYTLAAALPIAVQIALTFGAPWGRLTLGGRWPDRLPLAMRPVTLFQASLLALMSATMLARAGLIEFAFARALFWPAVGLTALTLVSNAITPSAAERKLWVPVISVMLICAILLAFSTF